MEDSNRFFNFNSKNNNSQSVKDEGLILYKNGRAYSLDFMKRQAVQLAVMMGRAVPERGVWFNMLHCGDFIITGVDENGDRRIVEANFCKARLCPLCQHRKSAKARAQVFDIVNHLEGYSYIFLTLTMKNEAIADSTISAALERLSKAWQRFTQRKRVRDTVLGYYKSVELTVDFNERISDDMYRAARKYYDERGLKAGDYNPNYYFFHPHIHAILAVPERYLSNPGRLYISQREFSELWRDALRVDYTPICDVRRIKRQRGEDETSGEELRAVLEVTKYCTKSADILAGDTSEDIKIMGLREIYYGTFGKRFASLGGVFKDMHKELGLSDIESEDEDENEKRLSYTDIQGFAWQYGVSGGKYVRNAMTEKMYKQLVKDRGY